MPGGSLSGKPAIRVFKAAAFLLCCATQPLAQSLPDPVRDADYRAVDVAEARLGQLLFYDPVLSGNKTVACATCHHPTFGTSDGVSLSIGDGGIGLGPARRIDPDNPPEQRIPRNSPGLFNLGARKFTVMFHDGRLEADQGAKGGLRSPLDADMMQGFASVLSAQTMFPVLSRDEMAGSYDENEIGRAVRQGLITGPGGAWDLLSQRVADLPAYADQFAATYPHIAKGAPIAFTDISNAIAAFIAFEWRSDTAPFDTLLRGDLVFDDLAQEGLTLFYGRGACAACHSGPFLTDHAFHAMGAPQIGPGKAATFEDHQRDEGRFRVTGATSDLYAFRTPSLRNIAVTAPYGHAGAHKDLQAFLTAHADPRDSLQRYGNEQAVLADPMPEDFAITSDPTEIEAMLDAITTPPVALTAHDIAAIEAFLATLTDPASLSGRLGVPPSVPSGLDVPQGLAIR